MSTLPQEQRTLCVDIDDTIAVARKDLDYASCEPMPGAIAALHQLKARGFLIALHTARHFNRLEETKIWLERHGVPYDHLVLGKPTARYYIDDRAIRFEGDWTQVLSQIGAIH